MEKLDSIALEFAIAGCSVVRGTLAGVDCMTVAGEGHTILVLIGNPDAPESRKAVDLWQDEICWCRDRSTAHAIARCLKDGDFC